MAAEKAAEMLKSGVYTFEVDRKATKTEIKDVRPKLCCGNLIEYRV